MQDMHRAHSTLPFILWLWLGLWLGLGTLSCSSSTTTDPCAGNKCLAEFFVSTDAAPVNMDGLAWTGFGALLSPKGVLGPAIFFYSSAKAPIVSSVSYDVEKGTMATNPYLQPRINSTLDPDASPPHIAVLDINQPGAEISPTLIDAGTDFLFVNGKVNLVYCYSQECADSKSAYRPLVPNMEQITYLTAGNKIYKGSNYGYVAVHRRASSTMMSNPSLELITWRSTEKLALARKKFDLSSVPEQVFVDYIDEDDQLDMAITIGTNAVRFIPGGTVAQDWTASIPDSQSIFRILGVSSSAIFVLGQQSNDKYYIAQICPLLQKMQKAEILGFSGSAELYSAAMGQISPLVTPPHVIIAARLVQENLLSISGYKISVGATCDSGLQVSTLKMINKYDTYQDPEGKVHPLQLPTTASKLSYEVMFLSDVDNDQKDDIFIIGTDGLHFLSNQTYTVMH